MPGTVGRIPTPSAPTPGAGAHPWAGTPLGVPESWDPAVRAVADVVLSSPVPMALLLGDDLTLLYNDGYAELIGDRHPAALGRPAAEVFAEVWREAGAGEALERVYRLGEPFLEREAVLPADRQAEPAVFTRGHSPVRDSHRPHRRRAHRRRADHPADAGSCRASATSPRRSPARSPWTTWPG